MDLIELTLEEAMEAFNKSRATIYNWTNSGKLRYKDDGDKRIILMTTPEMENLSPSKIDKSNNLNVPESKLDNNILINKILVQNDKLIEHNRELIDKLEMHMQESGKVKLLTDNNMFYQDEYFKIKHELESKNSIILELELNMKELEILRNRNKQLEIANKNQALRLEQLQTELETERNKKFFGIFKK